MTITISILLVLSLLELIRLHTKTPFSLPYMSIENTPLHIYLPDIIIEGEELISEDFYIDPNMCSITSKLPKEDVDCLIFIETNSNEFHMIRTPYDSITTNTVAIPEYLTGNIKRYRYKFSKKFQ